MNRRRTTWLLGLLLCSRASIASAHDFWMQPSEYWVAPDALTSVMLQVGHGPSRQRSPIAARRITRFQALTPGGVSLDMHDRLQMGQAAEDADFRFEKPGTYL